MKRLIVLCIGLAAASSLLWTGFAAAANVRTGEAPHVMSNEVVDGTLYAGGNTLRVEGRVQGDFICAGQDVDISGVIEGDVLCAAQKITISGEVQGDVRVAAQQVRLEGMVAGSVSLAGQQVDLSERSQVARDLTAVGQQVLLNGSVGRDAHAMAETFYANATLGRHLEVKASNISLGDKTKIAGDFIYTSSSDADVPASASVTGKTEHLIPEVTAATPQRSYVGSMLIAFLGFVVLGAAVLVAAPRILRATTRAISKSPLLTLGAGFAGLVLPPFIAGMLLLTIIGMPLALLVLFGWIISLLLGLVVSGQALGQIIVKKMGWQAIFAQLLGLGALFGVAFIPYVGPFVLLMAVIWGVGGQWHAVVTHRSLDFKVTKEKA